MDRMFYLDDADLKLVAKRRGDHVPLSFSLQLATVRYLGTFLADPLDVPPLVVERLAGQLGIADPSCVKRYPERPHTPLEHRDEIKTAGGLRISPRPRTSSLHGCGPGRGPGRGAPATGRRPSSAAG